MVDQELVVREKKSLAQVSKRDQETDEEKSSSKTIDVSSESGLDYSGGEGQDSDKHQNSEQEDDEENHPSVTQHNIQQEEVKQNIVVTPNFAMIK